EREEEVHGLDVCRPGRAGHLIRVEERTRSARSDRRSIHPGALGGRWQPGLDSVNDLLRGHPDTLDRLRDGGVLDDLAQDVQGIDLGLSAFQSKTARAL